MNRSRSNPATLTLERALARLATWQPRVLEVSGLSDELPTEARASIAPFLQELKDRRDRAENSVLRLEQLESGWRGAHRSVINSFAELERAWLALQHTLRVQRARTSASSSAETD